MAGSLGHALRVGLTRDLLVRRGGLWWGWELKKLPMYAGESVISNLRILRDSFPPTCPTLPVVPHGTRHDDCTESRLHQSRARSGKLMTTDLCRIRRAMAGGRTGRAGP